MATTPVPCPAVPVPDSLGLPLLFREPQWYALYTAANHEKHVAQQLTLRSIPHFLPVYSSVRRWKDRRVILSLPLFPGYVFVRIPLSDRVQVLQIPGVARFVEFRGVPAALPDDEIAALQRGLASGLPAQPHPFVRTGRRVRITNGPFAGLEGIVRRSKGRCRVVVSLDLIQRSVSVDVDATSIVPVISRKAAGLESRYFASAGERREQKMPPVVCVIRVVSRRVDTGS